MQCQPLWRHVPSHILTALASVVAAVLVAFPGLGVGAGDDTDAPLWDFIVVGAGTGGSLCAGRLAEAGAQVLVVEAGHWDDSQDYVKQKGKTRNIVENVWSYPTRLPGRLEVQNSRPYRHLVHAGKMVGGSSAVHDDIYDRPPFREFEYGGMSSWSAARVKAAFQRIEKDLSIQWLGHESLDDVDDAPYYLIHTITSTLQMPHHPKQHLGGGKGGVSAGWWKYRSCQTSHPSDQNCTRHNSYSEMVATRNATRAPHGLDVTTSSHAARVLLENGEAIGVEIKTSGRLHRAFARRGVILAAGAIGTPWLLTLSGIGDPFDLQRLGVPVRVANREVGHNLADHLAHFSWLLVKGTEMHEKVCEDREVFNMFLNVTTASAAVADEGNNHGAVEAEVRFSLACNYTRQTFDFGIESVLLQPESRGRVLVTSTMPEVLPVVEFPPLWERDFERMEALLTRIAGVFNLTGRDLSADREISLAESVRQNTYLYQHFCCSARAAPSGQPGVLDEDLAVRGVTGLYVADTSGLPFPPSAHSSSAALLVGELAAENALKGSAPRETPGVRAQEALQDASPSSRSALLAGAVQSSTANAPRTPTVQLSRGGPGEGPPVDMPRVALGTGTVNEAQVVKAVATFLSLGGRHLDTAAMYDNFKQLREGIQASGVNRSEVVVTSKVMPLGFDHVRRGIAAAIEGLGVPYLDVALLHWPGDITSGKLLHGAPLPACAEPDAPGPSTDSQDRPEEGLGSAAPPAIGTSWRRCREESYAALLQELKVGRVRAVGVSNFAERHLQDLADAGHAPPAVHQLEMHPFWHDDALLERHARDGTRVQAYGVLGGKHTGAVVLRHEGFRKIAERNNVTVAQVVLRWAIYKGVTVITGGTSDAHLKENLDVFDFDLEQADYDFIDAIPPYVMSKMYGPHPEEII